MDINNKLKSIMEEVISMPINFDEVDETTNLITKYDINSIKVLQLIIAIEDEFDIIIDDDYLVLKNFSSFKMIQEMLDEIMSQG